MYKIYLVYEDKTELWTLSEVLEEINRDRSDTWTPYDKSSVIEGWNEWVECNGYFKMLGD